MGDGVPEGSKAGFFDFGPWTLDFGLFVNCVLSVKSAKSVGQPLLPLCYASPGTCPVYLTNLQLNS